MTQALLVIDLQNDYFDGGQYPLWKADETAQHIAQAMSAAQRKGIPCVLIQHIADPSQGPSPFFNEGSHGAEIYPGIVEAAADAPVVIKRFADSFEQTELDATLKRMGVDELLVCGMMTQNCVTHTAISKAAEQYKRVTVLTDCCTTVDETLHMIALHALSTRVTLAPWATAI